MQVGSYLMADSAAGTVTVTIKTPWMRRQADNGVFTYEIIDTLGSPDFAVKVFHKKSEDKGTGTDAGVSFTASGDFHTAQVDGLNEMVRFEISLTSTSGGLEWVLYRFHEATWFNRAKG